MEQVNIIGIDLAKRSFQLHGARADDSVAFRRKVSRGEAAVHSRRAAAMRGGDGGLCERPLLGPGDFEARPRSEVGPADLREAVREAAEERRGGRGGDLRGGAAPDHALRGGEGGRATGKGDAVPHARSSGAPAHADDQRATWPPGRVRRRSRRRDRLMSVGWHRHSRIRVRDDRERSARWVAFCSVRSLTSMRRSADWKRSSAPARVRTSRRHGS